MSTKKKNTKADTARRHRKTLLANRRRLSMSRKELTENMLTAQETLRTLVGMGNTARVRVDAHDLRHSEIVKRIDVLIVAVEARFARLEDSIASVLRKQSEHSNRINGVSVKANQLDRTLINLHASLGRSLGVKEPTWPAWDEVRGVAENCLKLLGIAVPNDNLPQCVDMLFARLKRLPIFPPAVRLHEILKTTGDSCELERDMRALLQLGLVLRGDDTAAGQ